MNLEWHDILVAGEQLAGLAVVMATLLVLWGLTVLSGTIIARVEAMRPRPSPIAPDSGAASPADDAAGTLRDGLSEDELVVIAATVAAMIDGRHHVVSVRSVRSSWGQEGRRDIHASHRTR